MASDNPRNADEANRDEYRFWDYRDVKYPSNDFQAGTNMVKGCLGVGLFSMPYAFFHTGLFMGLACTAVAGFFCSYGAHQLVRCAQTLCVRDKVPSMQYAEVSRHAFATGPPKLQRFSQAACLISRYSLFVCWTSVCIVYIILIANNFKIVADQHAPPLHLRIYCIAVWPILTVLVMCRHLRFVAIFSLIANIFCCIAIVITLHYFLIEIPPISSRRYYGSVMGLPEFFGFAIFAMEGIGVILPLENSMKTPTHFTGVASVLSVSTIFLISVYAFVGFFGYLKYGDETSLYGTVTLNLPADEILAKSVNILMGVANLLSFALHFYVPFEILWTDTKPLYKEEHIRVAEFGSRVVLISMCVGFAVLLPDLKLVISLIGTVFLAILGLIYPCILYVITFWQLTTRIIPKILFILGNCIVLAFGGVALIIGTKDSVKNVINHFSTE